MPLGHSWRWIALSLLLLAAKPALALSCTAGSSALSFGVYDPVNTIPTVTTANITVTCQSAISVLVGYTISLTSGVSGNVGARAMASGGSAMSYQIYTSLLYTTVWGDGSAGSQTVPGGYLISVLTPIVTPYTAYARIPAKQNLAPGTYSDTVTVQVTY